MPRKSGCEPCRGSATYKWPPMGECDTYLTSRRQPGTLTTTWRQPCDTIATIQCFHGRQVVARMLPGCPQDVASVSPGCRQGDFFFTLATFKMSLCHTGLAKSKFSCTNRILIMQNSKYVSHSLIGEHLKRVEPRTVSFPPFRGIGPPTHLLGVGRGNLTK